MHISYLAFEILLLAHKSKVTFTTKDMQKYFQSTLVPVVCINLSSFIFLLKMFLGVGYHMSFSDAIHQSLVTHNQISLKIRSATYYGPDTIGPDMMTKHPPPSHPPPPKKIKYY